MRKDLKKRKEKSKRKKSFEDALPIHAGRCMKATTLPGGTVSAREYLYTCVSADAEKLRLSQVGLTHWSWQNIPSSSRQTNTPNKNTLLLKEEREREMGPRRAMEAGGPISKLSRFFLLLQRGICKRAKDQIEDLPMDLASSLWVHSEAKRRTEEAKWNAQKTEFVVKGKSESRERKEKDWLRWNFFWRTGYTTRDIGAELKIFKHFKN